jgi:hypothetical protein
MYSGRHTGSAIAIRKSVACQTAARIEIVSHKEKVSKVCDKSYGMKRQKLSSVSGAAMMRRRLHLFVHWRVDLQEHSSIRGDPQRPFVVVGLQADEGKVSKVVRLRMRQQAERNETDEAAGVLEAAIERQEGPRSMHCFLCREKFPTLREAGNTHGASSRRGSTPCLQSW